MEHRCGNRLTTTAGVWIRTHQGISGKAQLRNISASGALLRTPMPVALHAQLLVRFAASMPDERSDQQWVSAHVVRNSEDGLAVEWTEFSPDIVRHVLRSMGADAVETVSHGIY
jgi:c-di-GMP-binding flagellar brake protein YcgR